MADLTASPGENIEVDADIENTGSFEDTQDIILVRENGDVENVDIIEDLTLDGGQLEDVTLVWEDVEEGEYELCVESGDDVECISVNVSDLPDSVIDNFEDADADPAGPYKEGETIADYYTEDTGAYERTTDDVASGAYEFALKSTATGGQRIYSLSGDGLSRYPEPGDTITVLIKDPNDISPSFYHNLSVSDGNWDGYGARFDADSNRIRLMSYDNDDLNIEDENDSVDVSVGEWYEVEIDTPEDENDDLTHTWYDIDESDLSRQSTIDTLSVSDPDFVNNRGIGARRSSGSGTGAMLDLIQIDD